MDWPLPGPAKDGRCSLNSLVVSGKNLDNVAMGLIYIDGQGAYNC